MSWALRTADVLARRGREICLVVHREDAGTQALHPSLHPAISTVDLTHLPRLEECHGNLAPVIPAYRDAMRRLVGKTHRPVVFIPTLLGDSFGIAAALSIADPECIRTIGWQHSPVPYDGVVLSRYEPIISLMVAVSDEIGAALRAAHTGRVMDVRTIHHGIDAPATLVRRPPLAGRPLRLIYAGRMENDLKRAVSLVAISDALHAAHIDHRLMLVGDGPATSEIDGLVRTQGREARIRRLAPLPTQEVQKLLLQHDVFVQPSRVEGLSLSVLEAMAAGCVPVITRTPSGASQLIEPGISGELVDVREVADDGEVGDLFAIAIQRALAAGLPTLSAGTHRRVRERFSMEGYTAAVEHAIEDAARSTPRTWPTDLPCAFTAGGIGSAGSGSVPREAAARLRDLLASLAGKTIIIHGTGRHTIELAAVLAQSPARIAAFADDDPKRQGEMLWNWPIIAPAHAARTGASEVVVSSWMNQEAIWARREIYERQGLTAHRLYV